MQVLSKNTEVTYSKKDYFDTINILIYSMNSFVLYRTELPSGNDKVCFPNDSWVVRRRVVLWRVICSVVAFQVIVFCRDVVVSMVSCKVVFRLDMPCSVVALDEISLYVVPWEVVPCDCDYEISVQIESNTI